MVNADGRSFEVPFYCTFNAEALDNQELSNTLPTYSEATSSNRLETSVGENFVRERHHPEEVHSEV